MSGLTTFHDFTSSLIDSSSSQVQLEARQTSLPQPGDDQLAVAGCEEDDAPQEPDRKRKKRAAVQELMLCLLCRSGK